ncbi:MAG: DUF440 family protein [Cyanobacteria bacterium P01_G01_bin.54]
MSHTYKGRTRDEAFEMARLAFKANVAENLSPEEMKEFAFSAVHSSGTPSEEWEELLEFQPEAKSYYEIHLYKPRAECPYIEKSYAKILVPRNREKDTCEVIWKPEVPPYNGP